MSASSGEYVIQDPYGYQARRFMTVLHRDFGLRAVCFHTDPDRMRRESYWNPLLRSAATSANYVAPLDELPALADRLRQHHQIVAVIPYREPTLLPAETLAELLGLDWAQPEVVRRFRDKHLMKEHLGTVPGGPRLNRTVRVASAADVDSARASADFGKFVVKPIDGFGNTAIGFFDSSASSQDVERHLQQAEASTFVMEEFISGDEYFVDGQVDGGGEVTVIRVGRYQRALVNGRPNVELGTRRVPTTDPLFTVLKEYATSVVAATGLTRSPFHLEAIVDDRGPCLVEAAARLVGGGEAIEDGALHGSLDVYRVASHYYLTAEPYGRLPLDWDHYDASSMGHVIGYSSAHGRVLKVRGAGAVERLPSFLRWQHRPRTGDRLVQTQDLGGVPWEVVLRADSDASLEDAAESVRGEIQLNPPMNWVELLVRRAVVTATLAWRRVRASWFAFRMRAERLGGQATAEMTTAGSSPHRSPTDDDPVLRIDGQDDGDRTPVDRRDRG